MPKSTVRSPRGKHRDDTTHLLSSSENARRLRESLAEAERGNLLAVEFDETDKDRPLRIIHHYKSHKPVD